MAHRGDKVVNISSFDSRHEKIKQLLTCPICKKLLREVTAIDECLHIFCRKCITRKFNEERSRKCPVCQVDLGVFPLQKLRADYRWQSIRNSIKFKRQQFIKRGLIQKKSGKPQASEGAKAKQPEILSSDSLPVERDENSPVRKRKEKSISSVLGAETALIRYSPANARRKSGGRKANPPRRNSNFSLPPIKEREDHRQSSSNPVKLGNGEQQGRKQIIKPSNQDVEKDNKEQRTEKSGGMNAFLKPLDCLVGGAGTSNANMADTLPQSAAPSEVNGKKENEDKGKRKERRCNSRDQNDETDSVSRSKRSRNESHAEEKRPVVTEDLNVPAQVVVDASSCKCLRPNRIWFSLVVSEKQETYVPLPPLPPCYLMVKDANMPASFIRKYLAKKLRLYNDDEVVLKMRGKLISPDCTVENVMNLWMETTPTFEQIPGMVGGSAKDFVMVVTYGRNTSF